jgi:hypothetical protein
MDFKYAIFAFSEFDGINDFIFGGRAGAIQILHANGVYAFKFRFIDDRWIPPKLWTLPHC